MRTKLNESYLRRVVKESINKVLRENRESDDGWEDVYTDNHGNIIQSKGSGPNKHWRTKKENKDKKNNDGWEDVYMDNNGKTIQSRGSGPNKHWRTKK